MFYGDEDNPDKAPAMWSCGVRGVRMRCFTRTMTSDLLHMGTRRHPSLLRIPLLLLLLHAAIGHSFAQTSQPPPFSTHPPSLPLQSAPLITIISTKPTTTISTTTTTPSPTTTTISTTTTTPSPITTTTSTPTSTTTTTPSPITTTTTPTTSTPTTTTSARTTTPSPTTTTISTTTTTPSPTTTTISITTTTPSPTTTTISARTTTPSPTTTTISTTTTTPSPTTTTISITTTTPSPTTTTISTTTPSPTTTTTSTPTSTTTPSPITTTTTPTTSTPTTTTSARTTTPSPTTSTPTTTTTTTPTTSTPITTTSSTTVSTTPNTLASIMSHTNTTTTPYPTTSAITTTPAAPSTIPSTATLTTTDISSSNTPNTSAVSVPMSNATTPPLTSLTTPHPSPLHTASSNMTNEPMMSTMPYPSTILHSTSPIITSTANMTSKNTTPPGHSTPLPTTFTSNASTESAEVHCNFSQLCANQSVYYWMILAVEVTGDLKNESDISGWLWALFHSHLDTCEPYKPEQANGTNSTDTLQTTSVSPTYPTPYNMTTLSQNFINFSMTTLTTNMTTMLYNSISTPSHNHSMTTLSPSYTMSPNWPHSTTSEAHEGGNMTAASLFQDIEVTCVNKTGIRLVNLTGGWWPLNWGGRAHSNGCNGINGMRALWLGQENSTIQTNIVGNRVERVGKGLCAGQLPPSNGFAKCNGFLNGTLPLPDTCHTPEPVNISCGHAGTVYVPLGNQTQMNCGMPPKPPIEAEIFCNCSAYCYGKDAYYTLGIQIKDPAMNILNILYMIDQLKKPSPCTNTSETPPPCPLTIISTIYQDAHVECSGVNTNLQSCRVIVRLDHSLPICTVSTALMNLFNDKPGIGYNGTVTRAAICGWPGSSGGLLNSTFMWKEINLNPTMFCEVENTYDVISCKQGENVCVLLNETCDPMPPTTSPNPMANTFLPATTILSPPPTNTIQLNTSSLPLYTTLAPLNTTSTAPNTTLSAPNTTIATTTLGNTTTNPSTPIIPPVNPTTASPKYTTTAVITTTTAAPNTTAASSEEQANQLLDLTSNVSKLNSSQVDQLVSQLEALLAGPNVSLALGQTSVKIVSNLLGASSGTLASSSTKIIGIVDTVGLKLVVQQEATILTKSVAVAVKTVDGTNFQQTSFSIPDPNNVQIRGGGRARRSVRAEEGSLPQGSVTFPSSLTANLSPEQQLQASRLQFNFYQKSTVFQDRALGDSRLYSGILGASVANLSIKSLQEDVVITLRNTEPVPANFVVSCAFWDFGLNGGSGGWNRDGCSVRNSTDNETVCACNHLTSFGVLLDISRTGITNRLQATILTYITYIGCGISAIFLSITLLTYLAFGKLRKDMPSKILIQLCVALLFLNLVFLVDAWLALYPDAVGLCISTAWFLHYFLLASFTWMGLEAVHMYLALVKVFNTYITRYMLKFSLVGWGVPLLVVIVVIAVDKDNYGLVGYGKYSDGSPTDDFCWLKNNIAFYVSVVAYFCVIFLLNLSMFVVVMVQLCRIKSQNPHNMRHRNGLQDLRSVLGITLLLGLTWGFAFFAWGPVNLAFMYLFAIFNSFQGFFIFVFYCAVKENVRRQWRTYLCCGRLRLAENSDWSRTATQKTGKKSLSVTRATSLRSYNSSQFNHSSSSSFLTGDSPERPSGATGSPFDDRTITALEELNSDVVLNEVNSQFRTQSQRAP